MLPLPGVAVTLKAGMGSFRQMRCVAVVGCVVITGALLTFTITSFVSEQPSELVLVKV